MPIHTAVATLHTNYGDIVVNLFGDHAPRTVQNFVGLSDGSGSWTHPATGKPGEGPLYKDVVFHRIISRSDALSAASAPSIRSVGRWLM